MTNTDRMCIVAMCFHLCSPCAEDYYATPENDYYLLSFLTIVVDVGLLNGQDRVCYRRIVMGSVYTFTSHRQWWVHPYEPENKRTRWI
jgi:hypothetical protein